MTIPYGPGEPPGPPQPPTARPHDDDPPTTRLRPVAPGPAAPNSAAAQGIPAYAAQDHPPAPDARTRRPGRRIAPLLAAAVFLGVLGGVGYGYTQQAGEPPTPLPPLNQARLDYPEKPLPADEAPEPLSAKQDRRVRTDGDLRELLIAEPKGAVPDELGPEWLPVEQFAGGFEDPNFVLADLVTEGFRRAAATSWTQDGDTQVTIALLQFRDESALQSEEYLLGQQSYMPSEQGAGTTGVPIPGSVGGALFVSESPVQEPGYVPVYEARALARRGDIVLDMHIASSQAIAEDTAMAIAERQMERL